MDLKNKTVFLTGASRGIGYETALAFAKAGANVALVARSADLLEGLAQKIGPQALALPCDVSQEGSLLEAIEQTEATFGQIDILINNAAVIDPIARLVEADTKDWSQLIDINVKSVFLLMHHIAKRMKKNGGGTVLTVSSGAAHRAIEGWSAYCTSKAAAAMLTESLHLEESANGIRAMGLSPGTVATDMQKTIRASGINPVSQLDWSDHIPAYWPAKALLWMCSADADAYVGQEISLRDENIRRRIGLIAS